MATRFWQIIFFLLILFYGMVYAPFGINETDGGFLSGLAWQVLQGKLLYRDVIYVRPPLPILMRGLEMVLLPEKWEVLGERWIFYMKIAVCAWMGASILEQGAKKWQLSTFTFVVAVHNFPPMAWHTVDGVFFASIALWIYFSNVRFLPEQSQWWKFQPVFESRQVRWPIFSAIAIFAAMLCKQSFYPLFGLYLAMFFWDKNRKAAGIGAVTLLFCWAGYVAILWKMDILERYWEMTSGSAGAGQGLQHSVLDYFRINPIVGIVSAVLLFPLAYYIWRPKPHWAKFTFGSWLTFLLFLQGWWVAQIAMEQDAVAPFAAARLLFWLAVPFAWRDLRVMALLLVSWCAAISWGYNLPILFPVSGVYACFIITNKLYCDAFPNSDRKIYYSAAFLAVLLLTVGFAHQYIYRDGRRCQMTEHLGAIFPKLSGIYSDPLTADRYRQLRDLNNRYGDVMTVLPAFPQANYLTGTYPVLPLDWVVNRETNSNNQLIFKAIAQYKPVCLVEKSYKLQLNTNAQLTVTQNIVSRYTKVEETNDFEVWVSPDWQP